MARWAVSIMAVSTLVLGATACGGGSGGSSDEASTDACHLLTTDEAEELLGVPTGGGSEDTDRSSGTYCEWVSKDSHDDGDAASDSGDGPAPYFVSVEEDRGESAVQEFESAKLVEGHDDEGSSSVEPVSGLGDDAYFDVSGGLQVLSGDHVVSTYTRGNDLHPLTAEQRRDIERGAAKLAVKRVGGSTGGTDVDAATECGKSGRCNGTRYRACDLISDAEMQRITGFVVDEVDGTARPGESDTAGLCEWGLENEQGNVRENHRVELVVDPNRETATKYYRELRKNAEADNDGGPAPAPGLGPDAFYSAVTQRVIVLRDGTLFEVAYKVQAPDFTADTSPAVMQANLDLATTAVKAAAH